MRFQNRVSESDIETKLREKVRGLGGKAFKWVSPGNNGVPDRIVVMPEGKLYFVELKAPGQKLTKLQEQQVEFLSLLGHRVWVLASKEDVDTFIKFLVL